MQWNMVDQVIMATIVSDLGDFIVQNLQVDEQFNYSTILYNLDLIWV